MLMILTPPALARNGSQTKNHPRAPRRRDHLFATFGAKYRVASGKMLWRLRHNSAILGQKGASPKFLISAPTAMTASGSIPAIERPISSFRSQCGINNSGAPE